MKKILSLLVAAAFSVPLFADQIPESECAQPSGTYLFAQKDSADLYLDVYDPAPGSQTTLDGRAKPTILFMFGGGFKEGTRDNRFARKWFAMLCAEGYRVVSIDYRLGMKGKSYSRNPLTLFYDTKAAVDMAVEDLYSATAFIIDNAEELGIDPASIVLSGSSAGAISVLQAEWELCNRSERAAVLPEDFRYAGVMSFSGAIISGEGSIRYATEPAPTLLLHGTADKLVVYGQIAVMKIHYTGSDALAKTFQKNAYNYNILRYEGAGHEVAMALHAALPEEIRFLETNVVKGEKRIVDATLSDSSLPSFPKSITPKDIYK